MSASWWLLGPGLGLPLSTALAWQVSSRPKPEGTLGAGLALGSAWPLPGKVMVLSQTAKARALSWGLPKPQPGNLPSETPSIRGADTCPAARSRDKGLATPRPSRSSCLLVGSEGLGAGPPRGPRNHGQQVSGESPAGALC